MAKKVRAARIRRKGNNVVLDLASGVSVTARRQSGAKLSSQAAYQTAKANLLSSQVRALERAIATKVLSSTTPGVNTGASQFALEKQLTDARITAADGALLRKQVNDIAASMTGIERSWSALKNTIVPNKLKLLAKDYIARVSALNRLKTSPLQRNTSLAKLNDMYQYNKSSIVDSARQEKDRLSTQLADQQSLLLAKKMELEKALHADRQVRVLQQEINQLRPTPSPSIVMRTPRVRRKIKKTRRRRPRPI